MVYVSELLVLFMFLFVMLFIVYIKEFMVVFCLGSSNKYVFYYMSIVYNIYMYDLVLNLNV